jgi:hypothetical protein
LRNILEKWSSSSTSRQAAQLVADAIGESIRNALVKDVDAMSEDVVRMV